MAMSESLSLAARLAANLFVDAINLAKPAGRLAGKIGDRLLGGSPFNEREAQRFLTMGGSEWLDRAEEANEVLDPFWADGGPTEWLDSPRDWNCVVGGSVKDDQVVSSGPEYRIGAHDDPNADVHLCKTWRDGKCHCALVSIQLSDGTIYTDYIDNVAQSADVERAHDTIASACRAIDELGMANPVGTFTHGFVRTTTPSNPAGAAASEASIGGAIKTAPGVQPPVEQAPGPAQTSPSCAGPGATSMPQALQQLDDLLAMRHQGLRGLTIEPRSEHPMYAQIQDVADAAVVAGVLGGHQCFWNDDEAMYHCIRDDELHATFGSYNQWIAHVSPLVIAELKQ